MHKKENIRECAELLDNGLSQSAFDKTGVSFSATRLLKKLVISLTYMIFSLIARPFA